MPPANTGSEGIHRGADCPPGVFIDCSAAGIDDDAEQKAKGIEIQNDIEEKLTVKLNC